MAASLPRRTLLAAALALLSVAAQAQEDPASGPDIWTVAGLSPGSRLNLRAEPSFSARILGRLSNGDTLHNRGCRVVDEERWCRVERAGGSGGWASARYLRDATGGAPRAPEAVAIFEATGTLPCAMIPGQPTRDCAYGAVRSAPGTASIRIVGTGGEMRWIYFDQGVPVRTDGSGVFLVERMADLFLIRVGNERYEVPLSVATGR
jgi:uncharacterized protein YraI